MNLRYMDKDQLIILFFVMKLCMCVCIQKRIYLYMCGAFIMLYMHIIVIQAQLYSRHIDKQLKRKFEVFNQQDVTKYGTFGYITILYSVTIKSSIATFISPDRFAYIHIQIQPKYFIRHIFSYKIYLYNMKFSFKK